MKIKKLNESKLSFKMYDGRKRINESCWFGKYYDVKGNKHLVYINKDNMLDAEEASDYIENNITEPYTKFIFGGTCNKADAEKDGMKLIESKPLKEQLWDSSRVIDLVKYYLDGSNIPTRNLVDMIKRDMEKEGSKLPYNITDFFDAVYRAVDDYNSQFEDDLDESYDTAERLTKLLSRPLKLDKYDKEMFEHDINNLRADEWLDMVKALPDKTPGRDEFIKLFDKDNEDLEESFDTSLDFPYMFFYNCNNPTYGYDFQLYARSLGARKVYGRYKGTGSGTYFYLVPSEDVYNKLKAVAKDKYTIDMQRLLPYNKEEYPNIQFMKESLEIEDEFWTKEELIDFADDVCAHINETFTKSYDTLEVYFTNGIIELTVSDGETEFATKYKPDMRKVKKPRDIERFVLPVAADIIEQIKGNNEPISEDLSGEYSDKFKKLITKLDEEDNKLAPILRDMIRYCKEDDLKDLWNEKDYDKLLCEEYLKEYIDVRANTNKLIEMAEEQIISWQSIAEASLMYMSETDVADMARLYNWVEDNEDEDEAPYSVRKVTNEVTELAEDGVISWESIVRAALRFMSEYDVTNMASMYSWIEDDEDDDLYESFNEKDILNQIDQFKSTITVKPEDEKAVKNILRKKNISFKIDDSKEGKLKFKLNYKPLKEDFDGETLNGPKEGPESGLASLINSAIQDEFSTIQLYNDLAVTARSEGYEDIATVIDSINTDENTHVGQLQDLLKTISPNANAIDDAETVVNDEETITESGISGSSNQEYAEKYYEIGKLEDFVSDNLKDGSITTEELLNIAKNSSIIEIDDMKTAIKNCL